MSWIASSTDEFKSMFFKAFSYFDEHRTIYSFRIVDNEESEFLFKCPSKPHIWYDRVNVNHSHHVECLVHLTLMSRGYERVVTHCPDCGKKHQEIFRLLSLDAWETIINPLIHEVNGRVENKS
uniref:Bacteriophage T5 Orf172 DNA-binding domain-containing protein n=1 Tax=Moniliophthora roreri TaxID=221103 RepID=A0A0W0FHM8_MONRR